MLVVAKSEGSEIIGYDVKDVTKVPKTFQIRLNYLILSPFHFFVQKI